GINGAVCLHALCWSSFDHHILHTAELLLNAGADPSIDMGGCDEGVEGILNSISWRSGDWMTGDYDTANIFEAYYLMAERALKGKIYQGIRSFRDCVGKTVTRVEQLKAKDEQQIHPCSFSEFIVFWCEDMPLVVSNYIEFMANPYYRENGLECMDISEEFQSIIGQRVRGLRYQTANYARMSFENGESILFGNDIWMGERRKPVGKYLIGKTEQRWEKDDQIRKLMFTSGVTHSDEFRVYHYNDVYIKANQKLYRMYSKGRSYKEHTLITEEIPCFWGEKLSRTIDMQDFTVEEAWYEGNALQWIQLKSGEEYLFLRVDTFEGIYLIRTDKKDLNPFYADSLHTEYCKRIEFLDK
ncbi:MAG: hypothetical protein II313_03725, partial [Anaerotignum sp.]|nr:hypothetical protein [Anaerotignum sp.]